MLKLFCSFLVGWRATTSIDPLGSLIETRALERLVVVLATQFVAATHHAT